jgi:prepilin-type N-terminal cleavage/methylation domain-containing protein
MRRKELWSHKQESGFTLVEVIVVLTLILLLAGLIYPLSGAINKRLLIKLSLEQIKSDLEELSSQALGGGVPPIIIFEPEQEYYRIELGDLSLKRQLAGLKVAAETETRIIISDRINDAFNLTLLASDGKEYQIIFNNQGEVLVGGE